MLRFLHAADLHLDTPFHGVGRSRPEWQRILRDASLSAFDHLIAEAMFREVDCVVIAGDIYDGSERGVRAQARFLSGLRKLHEAGIPSFFIHGNHDPVEEGWSALKKEDFPSSVTVFDKSDRVESKAVMKEGRAVAVIHGISFRTAKEARNLAALFPAEPARGPFHIGLLHANVGGHPEHGNYAPCNLDDLRKGGMDYWALGHIHKREVLLRSGPAAVYPGNLQARSFKETGAKGATLVEVGDDGSIALERVALDVARFVRLMVSADGCKTVEQVYSACQDAVERALAEAEGRRLLVRLSLAGATAAHRDLLTAVASGEVLDSLHDRLDTAKVWVARLTPGTSAPVDRERLRQAPGFLAELIQASDELAADPSAAVEAIERLKDPLRTGARFREFLDQVSEEEAAKIFGRAENRLLGLLEEPES